MLVVNDIGEFLSIATYAIKAACLHNISGTFELYIGFITFPEFIHCDP